MSDKRKVEYKLRFYQSKLDRFFFVLYPPTMRKLFYDYMFIALWIYNKIFCFSFIFPSHYPQVRDLSFFVSLVGRFVQRRRPLFIFFSFTFFRLLLILNRLPNELLLTLCESRSFNCVSLPGFIVFIVLVLSLMSIFSLSQTATLLWLG